MTSEKPARRRWGRWVLLVLALALVAALAAPSFMSERADQAIRRRVEQYHAAGEPVCAADLATPAVADEDNAVVEIRQAARDYNKYIATSAAWKQYDPSDGGYPLTAKERPLAEQILADNAALFPLLDAAMAKDQFYWPNTPTSPLIGWMLPDLSPQRALARFTALAALTEHSRGNDAAALLDLERTLFLAKALRHHPQALVVSLVTVGIDALATDRLMEILPDLKVGTARGAASPDALATLIRQLLDEADLNDTFRRGLLTERVLNLDTAAAIFAGGASARAVSVGLGGAGALAASPLTRYVAGPWMRGDVVLMLDAITSMADALRSPDWPTADQKVIHLGDPVAAAPIRHFWASILLPSCKRAIETQYRCYGARRLAATALAIRWYAADHAGQLPPTLGALVPRYLPAVPRDPFVPGGTAPLRYIPTDPDPRLYSVGHNGLDDGGSDKSTNPNTPHLDRWNHLDAVVHLRLQPRDVSGLPDDLKD